MKIWFGRLKGLPSRFSECQRHLPQAFRRLKKDGATIVLIAGTPMVAPYGGSVNVFSPWFQNVWDFCTVALITFNYF